MSWLYGYLSTTHIQEKKRLRTPLFTFESETVSIHAGGTGKNLLCFDHPNLAKHKVFVLGDPILRNGDDYSYPLASDWAEMLQDKSKISNLDGHWLLLIAGPERISAYNDPLAKRSLFIHKARDYYFFCSELPLIKEAGLAQLDPYKFGAYWHSLFPPHKRRYAPSTQSYFKDVEMLYQGGRLELTRRGMEMQCSPFIPQNEPGDMDKRMQNLCLLPLKNNLKVCVGLSGGLDIRALLAILIDSGMPFDTVHFGTNEGADYNISRQIATDFKLPFRFIPDQQATRGWDSACEYLYKRGFGYNPASSALMGYFPILGADADVFLDGMYGELFRFRSMFAHFYSIINSGKADFRSFGNYLYMQPETFFIPEINRILYTGFWDSLKAAVAELPPPETMPKPLWMNLFYVRFSPRTINYPDLCDLDLNIRNHMPFLQSSVIEQHWHYGMFKQYNEGLHRGLINKYEPRLRRYPLAIGGESASYFYRTFALKARIALEQRIRKPSSISRTERFLQDHQAEVLDLAESRMVKEDAWLDHQKIHTILKAYYLGDNAKMNALLSFISYSLGK